GLGQRFGLRPANGPVAAGNEQVLVALLLQAAPLLPLTAEEQHRVAPAQRGAVVGELRVYEVAHVGVHVFGRVEGADTLAVLHNVVVHFQRHVEVGILSVERVVVLLHARHVGAVVLERE
nr:hypothetical protein [Tanacetum cinerariifolium]